MMRKLKLDSLSKSYGSNCIFESVSIEYAAGLLHGVIGNNGVGKTTLFNCISGYEPFDGKIERTAVRSIGYLQVEPYMFPRITGREFIYFCLHAKKIGINKQEIHELNELFELPLDKYAEHYSTGMLKKLHIMSLILQKNDLLLLDEPFNGLDIFSSSYLTEILKKLKQSNIIIIVSSHALHHLVDFCDTLSFVRDKRIDFLSDRNSFKDLIVDIEEQTRHKIEQILK